MQGLNFNECDAYVGTAAAAVAQRALRRERLRDEGTASLHACADAQRAAGDSALRRALRMEEID
jgi:hypothetical protein